MFLGFEFACSVGGIVRRVVVLFEIVEMEVVIEVFEKFLECPGFVVFFLFYPIRMD